MATLKAILFIAVLIMTFAAVSSEGLSLSDESANASELSEVSSTTAGFVSEANPVEVSSKELLTTCANKFIKSCEQGSICRQIVCPAQTKIDVRLHYGFGI